jgi:hypothetical protein
MHDTMILSGKVIYQPCVQKEKCEKDTHKDFQVQSGQGRNSLPFFMLEKGE